MCGMCMLEVCGCLGLVILRKNRGQKHNNNQICEKGSLFQWNYTQLRPRRIRLIGTPYQNEHQHTITKNTRYLPYVPLAEGTLSSQGDDNRGRRSFLREVGLRGRETSVGRPSGCGVCSARAVVPTCLRGHLFILMVAGYVSKFPHNLNILQGSRGFHDLPFGVR